MTPTQLFEHREVQLLLPRAFILTGQCSQYWKALCLLPKDKGKYQLSLRPFGPQWCPVCKMCWYDSYTNLVGETKQDLI